MTDMNAIRARLDFVEKATRAYENENTAKTEHHYLLALKTFERNAPDDIRALLDQHDADRKRIAALETALRTIVEMDNMLTAAGAIKLARRALD